MTINELIAEVTEINTANGWRERDETPLTGDHPVAQIAAMTEPATVLSGVIEAIRAGGRKADEAYWRYLYRERPFTLDRAGDKLVDDLREWRWPVYGSRTEALCRLRLIDTETAEASEAVINGDLANLAEELADIVIRVLDFVGAWNEAHPGREIDLEAAIRAKLEKNRARGWRHGGKLA